MAGSPVLSINFTNRLIPAKPNYLMSIKNSQAILKCFIDLKSSVWFSFSYRIGRTTVSHIIKETLHAIWLALKDKYVGPPKHANDWKNIFKG